MRSKNFSETYLVEKGEVELAGVPGVVQVHIIIFIVIVTLG